MSSFKCLVVLFSCLPVLAGRAGATGIQLIRQAGNNHVNAIDEQLHRGMKWSHGGYLVMDVLAGQAPVFYTLDRDGNWTDTAQFRNPEPALLDAFSFDRQSDGTIVFSGQTYIDAHNLSPFIAWISSNGKVQRLLHSGNYFPRQLVVAPDDTIWTLGYEMVNQSWDDPAVNKEAHILRHFDKTGNLISSAFPQSQFNRQQRFCISTGLLVATSDRLAWYGSL